MVRLNPAQEKLLAELAAAKATYDAQTLAFETWLGEKRDGRKAPIRNLATTAEQSGVPRLRIYRALGFEQPGPYNNFLRPTVPVYTDQQPWSPSEAGGAVPAVSIAQHSTVELKFEDESESIVLYRFDDEEWSEDKYLSFQPGVTKYSIIGNSLGKETEADAEMVRVAAREFVKNHYNATLIW